jgi:hypothetical protein
MADLVIDDIWTFYDVNKPDDRMNSFDIAPFLPVSHPLYISPFGIALQVTCAYPMAADIRIQLVNYRQDPSHGKMWFGRNGPQTTIDLDGDVPGLGFLNGVLLPKGQAQLWIWWPRYSDLFGAVGGGLRPCIGALRAQIQSGYANMFAATDPYHWKWNFVEL